MFLEPVCESEKYNIVISSISDLLEKSNAFAKFAIGGGNFSSGSQNIENYTSL